MSIGPIISLIAAGYFMGFIAGMYFSRPRPSLEQRFLKMKGKANVK